MVYARQTLNPPKGTGIANTFTTFTMNDFSKIDSKMKFYEELCKFRVASYPLQDRHFIKDDWIVGLEEDMLNNLGYDYEDYQEWKSNTQEYMMNNYGIEY